MMIVRIKVMLIKNLNSMIQAMHVRPDLWTRAYIIQSSTTINCLRSNIGMIILITSQIFINQCCVSEKDFISNNYVRVQDKIYSQC